MGATNEQGQYASPQIIGTTQDIWPTINGPIQEMDSAFRAESIGEVFGLRSVEISVLTNRYRFTMGHESWGDKDKWPIPLGRQEIWDFPKSRNQA